MRKRRGGRGEEKGGKRVERRKRWFKEGKRGEGRKQDSRGRDGG